MRGLSLLNGFWGPVEHCARLETVTLNAVLVVVRGLEQRIFPTLYPPKFHWTDFMSPKRSYKTVHFLNGCGAREGIAAII